MTGKPITRAKREFEVRLFASPDALEGLLDEIAEGLGMAGWCRRVGVRYRECVAWVMSDTERARTVDDAQRARARMAAEAGEAIGRKLAAPDVRTGVDWIDDGPAVLDAKAARVALDAFKFASSTGDRERFGRSVQHTHTHRMQSDHLQALKRASALGGPPRPTAIADETARARAALPVIDAEYRALPAPNEVQRIESIRFAVCLPALPVSRVDER